MKVNGYNMLKVIIIVLLVFILLSAQLLLILILFFRKHEFEKAKERSILFTLNILDEFLKSKNKEELEVLRNNLITKKDNFFSELMLSFKKLKNRDKKILKDEIDIIFNKIEETFQEKLGDYSSNAVLNKIENLFDKFTENASKKNANDISINIPSKFYDMINNDKINNDNLNDENSYDIEKNKVLEVNKRFEKFDKLKSLEPSSSEEFKEVPKIPKEYFDQNLKEDELADQIRTLTIKETELQVLLESIYKKAKADKLSLLINTNQKFSFIQIHKIGFNDTKVSRILLNDDNVLIKQLYSMQRIIYAHNYSKYGNIFSDIKITQELKDVNALFIFPVKIYGDTRALILLFFETNNNKNLEYLVNIFKDYSKLIKKNIMKLL